MTQDVEEVQGDVSDYEPETQVEEPIPESSPLELRPSTVTEEEVQGDVSDYEPETQVEEPIPESSPLELWPSTVTEEEEED